ncbi:hypothetical protein V1512DRAFT_275356 [Lipomyces arxii]|uniref:uncharacterized protein n=1 Tax=Lipomyces arxii TaxID=56418 RepID=UPI0034D00088
MTVSTMSADTVVSTATTNPYYSVYHSSSQSVNSILTHSTRQSSSSSSLSENSCVYLSDSTLTTSIAKNNIIHKSLLSLPSEILRNIFDHVVSDRYEPKKYELLPLGRVCSKLCSEVDRYLYASVEISSVTSFNKLISTLLTSPITLTPLVQSFTYTAPGEFTPRSATGYQPSDLTPILAHLPTLLHICFNLDSLSLQNVNDVTLKDWEHLFPASAAAVNTISSFTWSYYSGWRRGRNFSRVWFSVLSRFTGLTHINLANCLIDPDALENVPEGAFKNVKSVSIENICFSMEGMAKFASLFPNVEELDMKTIKVSPPPPTPYHPLPPLFKHLKSLSIDCPSRILSNQHHICSFLAPRLRNTLESLYVSGGCSLCPSFFNNLQVDVLHLRLSQLRVCHGFENLRDVNNSVVKFIDSNPTAKRVLIDAPSLAVVDRTERNYSNVTDIGRRGEWILADVDYRIKKRAESQNVQKCDTDRVQIVGLEEQRLLDLESEYEKCHSHITVS